MPLLKVSYFIHGQTYKDFFHKETRSYSVRTNEKMKKPLKVVIQLSFELSGMSFCRTGLQQLC